MNSQVNADSLKNAATIRVLVRSGKVLILHKRDGARHAVAGGEEIFGTEDVLYGKRVVHFPSLDADISLFDLKERWDAEIVDAWKRVNNQEQELFQ